MNFYLPYLSPLFCIMKADQNMQILTRLLSRLLMLSLLALLLGACAAPAAVPPEPNTSLPAANLPPALTPTWALSRQFSAVHPARLTLTPVFTPTLIPSLTPAATSTVQAGDPALYTCLRGLPSESARVTKIVDGDSIEVRIGESTYQLRYIGIDTPEYYEALGDEASALNSQLVMYQAVTLFKDVSETDRYGRLLRYVLVGEVFVNYELVRAGLASASSYPPDTACDRLFAAAQEDAKAAVLGLWAPLLITTSRSNPIDIQPTSAGNCDPAYPTVCIAPPPPDLDCVDIPYRRFQVLAPDPHNFDGDHDGIGCEG
jgi:micrococcal nuclease